jgi:hypothetical protein
MPGGRDSITRFSLFISQSGPIFLFFYFKMILTGTRTIDVRENEGEESQFEFSHLFIPILTMKRFPFELGDEIFTLGVVVYQT